MLSELYIRNFAIIDELRLRFAAGFNVLTGETGAGKSIILDAMTLVLGDRADSSMIRTGSSQAYVEATFELGEAARRAVMPLLVEEGLDESPDHIIVAREVRLNGRSISRVNGRSVNLSLLRQIAGPLIDIHGQGEHLSLLKPRSHLPMLDSFAGLSGERSALEQLVSRLHGIQRELGRLRQDDRLLAQRLDMLEFQLKEIDAAQLQMGEEEELREERVRLANAEQLMQFSSEAVALLVGAADEQEESVLDRLGRVERALDHLKRFDATQTSRLEGLQGLAFQLDELAGELQRYRDELAFNPGRLNAVEERLELIGMLKRKYGPDIPAVLAWRDKAAAELKEISNSEERIAELEHEEDLLLHDIGAAAWQLSQKRKKAGERLASFVERQLAELNMEGTRFTVEFSMEPSPKGAYVEIEGVEQRLAFDKSGVDKVQFLISTNPGEPLKPMAKVASGGETSRLMLALKTALMDADATPTLIFDEIDQGIGGRIGDVAGRKLWGLTTSAQHQVIVVTHLPQLAGYGDSHFHVSKLLSGGRTTTAVVDLDEHGRIDELAAMLGTHGEHATGGAESILQRAAAAKQEVLGTHQPG